MSGGSQPPVIQAPEAPVPLASENSTPCTHPHTDIIINIVLYIHIIILLY